MSVLAKRFGCQALVRLDALARGHTRVCPDGAILLQAHAIRVVCYGARPIREYTLDSYVLCEHM